MREMHLHDGPGTVVRRDEGHSESVHPVLFFVKGVDGARLVVGQVAHKPLLFTGLGGKYWESDVKVP
jgi:hypothetical protein